MKVLLLAEVPKVGRKGEIVDISDGYAKNFLIRKKLAVIATPQLIEQYEARKRKETLAKDEKNREINKIAGEILKETFEFTVKTGKNEEVFSSINSSQLIERIFQFLHSHGGNALTEEDIKCESKPIKILGEHNVAVKIGKGDYGKEIKIKIKIVPEKV